MPLLVEVWYTLNLLPLLGFTKPHCSGSSTSPVILILGITFDASVGGGLVYFKFIAPAGVYQATLLWIFYQPRNPYTGDGILKFDVSVGGGLVYFKSLPLLREACCT